MGKLWIVVTWNSHDGWPESKLDSASEQDGSARDCDRPAGFDRRDSSNGRQAMVTSLLAFGEEPGVRHTRGGGGGVDGLSDDSSVVINQAGWMAQDAVVGGPSAQACSVPFVNAPTLTPYGGQNLRWCCRLSKIYMLMGRGQSVV